MSDFSDSITEDFYDTTGAEVVDLARKMKSKMGIETYLEDKLRDHDVFFTPGAYMLLAAALQDAAYFQRIRQRMPGGEGSSDFSLDDVRKTIDIIVREAKENPAYIDRYPEELPFRSANMPGSRPGRSAISVIKAFWKRYCNIPPLCGRTEKNER
jgi:hypothetical protein